VIGTGVLAPAGLINELQAAFHISASAVGSLIGYGAAVLCIEAQLLACATNRIDRRGGPAISGLVIRFQNATKLAILTSKELFEGRPMRRTSLSDAICPVARSLDEIGDWWTMLIIRDAFAGIKRFSDFQRSLGLAKNILSARLRTLVENGILTKQLSSAESARGEYHLTDKGRRLRVVLTALRQWGEDNLFAEGEPMTEARDPSNRPLARIRLMDQDGRPLEPEDIVITRGRKRSPHASSTKTARRARDK
jgi:DNA-binding HxlR family transcriptional regulator